MRLQSKPNTGKPGISTANAYRCSVKSAATDIEALVDAYGVEALIKVAKQIHDEIAVFGDSRNNGFYNSYLNDLEYPTIRKQHNRAKSRKRS